MAPQRHEIPTHLTVEDRAFYGLTARQLMWLTVGCAGGYGLWTQWPDLPAGIRLALAGVCLTLAVVLALVRPHGRGLEEWAFVALHYAALPKVSAWRPREPELAVWRPAGQRWAALTPRLRWQPAPEREEAPR
jgi:hypothetical protein